MNDFLSLDTVSANITNRVAAGGVLRGDLSWNGGLLVQGHVDGSPLVVHGALVVMDGASIRGEVTVHGDAFLFGQAGEHDVQGGNLQLTVHGIVKIGPTAKTYGRIQCQSFETYVGSQVNSAIATNFATQ